MSSSIDAYRGKDLADFVTGAVGKVLANCPNSNSHEEVAKLLYEKLKAHFGKQYKAKMLIFLDCIKRFESGLLDQLAYISFLQCFFLGSPELYQDVLSISYQTGFLSENAVFGKENDAESDPEFSDDGDYNRHSHSANYAPEIINDDHCDDGTDFQKRKKLRFNKVVPASESAMEEPVSATFASTNQDAASMLTQDQMQLARFDVQVFLQAILQTVGFATYEMILDEFVEMRSYYRLGLWAYFVQKRNAIRDYLILSKVNPLVVKQLEVLFPAASSSGSFPDTNEAYASAMNYGALQGNNSLYYPNGSLFSGTAPNANYGDSLFPDSLQRQRQNVQAQTTDSGHLPWWIQSRNERNMSPDFNFGIPTSHSINNSNGQGRESHWQTSANHRNDAACVTESLLDLGYIMPKVSVQGSETSSMQLWSDLFVPGLATVRDSAAGNYKN